MTTTSLISGPASSILHSRLQLTLTSLNSILQELSVTELHIYLYPGDLPSIYLRTSDGRRWGGHRCGTSGATEPDLATPPPPTNEPPNAIHSPAIEDPAPIKSPTP